MLMTHCLHLDGDLFFQLLLDSMDGVSPRAQTSSITSVKFQKVRYRGLYNKPETSVRNFFIISLLIL
jgi:hypothetical protein